VTGLGSPIGNLLVPQLVGIVGSISGHAYSDNNGNGINDDGDTPLSGVTIYIDSNNNGELDVGGTQTASTGTLNPALTIPDNSTTGVSSALSIANMSSAVSSISLTLNISHVRDGQLSAFLIGPDGTQITLFSNVGGFGQNFSNTTLSDGASTLISSGSAPFAGTYKPSTAFGVFNGKSANGTWTLLVKDGVQNRTGTLNSWSLTVTTATETSTVTAADGSYTLGPIAGGNYVVRAVTPDGFVDTSQPSATVNVTGAVTGADFSKMPIAFSSSGPDDSFYVWLNGSTLNISKSGSATNPVYQLPGSVVSTLTFHLTTAGAKLVVDYSGGDPLPPNNIVLDGGGLPDTQLTIIGGTNPILFTDTQVGETDGPSITYSNLAAISFFNSEVHFHGTLENLQNLTIDAGTVFYWS
jgi:subtilisin-like proprotein convertase family protein